MDNLLTVIDEVRRMMRFHPNKQLVVYMTPDFYHHLVAVAPVPVGHMSIKAVDALRDSCTVLGWPVFRALGADENGDSHPDFRVVAL